MTVYYVVLLLLLIFGLIISKSDRVNGIEIIENGTLKHSKNATIMFILCASVLIFVAGFRYRVGTDFGAYYFYSDAYAARFFESLKTLDEPGFPLIALIARLFPHHGAASIFIAALVTISLPLITLYRNSNRLGLALLFFLFFFWDGCFNGVRQYLAAAILFCGCRYLKDADFWKYVLVTFIAFLFHRSAIVMIVPYFVLRRKVNLKNLFLLIVITIGAYYSYDLIFNVADAVMNTEYSLENAYTSHAVNILRVLVALAPIAIFVPVWVGHSTEEDDFYLNIIIINAVVRIITMNSALLYRIGIYTTLPTCIAIPYLLKPFNKKSQRFIIICMVLLYGYYWWYEISNSYDLNHFRWVFPYL